jgi:hypothetical protein
MHFKDYLIEKINNTDNEADIVLHQIINNVDEAHVDYTDDRLDFNVGVMIKRSNYTRLFVTILRESDEQVRLAKNTQSEKNGFTIVVETDDYPARTDIDMFLSTKGVYGSVKSQVMVFIDNYKSTGDEVKTEYESTKELNTPEGFEQLYNEAVKEMKQRVEEYKQVAIDLNHQLENTSNQVEMQTLVRGLEKAKEDRFGKDARAFKKEAAEAAKIDLTKFEKEYSSKFEARMNDFYESVIQPL